MLHDDYDDDVSVASSQYARPDYQRSRQDEKDTVDQPQRAVQSTQEDEERQLQQQREAARLMIDIPTRVPQPSATIDQFLQSDNIKIDTFAHVPKLVYEFTLEDSIRGLDPSSISIFSIAQFLVNFPTKTIVVTYRDGRPSFMIQDRVEHITVDVPSLFPSAQRNAYLPTEFTGVARLVYDIIADCSRDSVGVVDVCATHYEIQTAASTISIIVSVKSADRFDIDLSLFCSKIAPTAPAHRIRRLNSYGVEVPIVTDPTPQYVSLLKYVRITPDSIVLYFPQHVPPSTKRKIDETRK